MIDNGHGYQYFGGTKKNIKNWFKKWYYINGYVIWWQIIYKKNNR